MSSHKLNINSLLPGIFLVLFAFIPLTNLLWRTEFGFFKGNWTLYPFILIGIVFSIAATRKIPKQLFFICFAGLLYVPIFIFQGGEFESLFRFIFTLLPLAFLPQIRNYQQDRLVNAFLIIYTFSVCVPVYISYLQLTGRFPYFEFDSHDGAWVGRISGGYNKPNNLIAVIFPVFLLGLYFLSILKKRFLGAFLILAVLSIVYITYLRTALVIFIVIMALLFRTDAAQKIIIFYYRNYLNFFTGILAIVFFCTLYLTKGTVDGIRGRIPMWQAHSYEFIFNSNPIQILFGKNKVQLPLIHDDNPLVGSLQEAHNNTIRIIVTFGLVGFFLYCLLIRHLALQVNKYPVTSKIKFLYFACFIFYILYSITNEAAFYSGVFWCIFIWIFLNPKEGRTPAQL